MHVVRRFYALAMVISIELSMPLDAGELPLEARIGAAIDRVVAKQQVTAASPGVAVCVIQPGHFRVLKGYGLANLKSKAAIPPKTMFELASVTKTLTSTAVLILHERGKLSIHDDVRKFIPELPEYNRSRPIRIVDLLSQVSGLPEYFGFEDVPQENADYWTNDVNGYGHDGSWGGFRTSYYRYLSADRTTIVLSNKGDFDTDGFWYALDAAIERAMKDQ